MRNETCTDELTQVELHVAALLEAAVECLGQQGRCRRAGGGPPESVHFGAERLVRRQCFCVDEVLDVCQRDEVAIEVAAADEYLKGSATADNARQPRGRAALR